MPSKYEDMRNTQAELSLPPAKGVGSSSGIAGSPAFDKLKEHDVNIVKDSFMKKMDEANTAYEGAIPPNVMKDLQQEYEEALIERCP